MDENEENNNSQPSENKEKNSSRSDQNDDGLSNIESNSLETMEIEIPEDLRYILKEYAKSLIRSQPDDLLQWSAEYFRSKVKENTEEEGPVEIGGKAEEKQ